MPFFHITLHTVVDLLQYARRKNVSLFVAAEHARELPSIKDDERVRVDTLLHLIRDHAAFTTTQSVGQIVYQFLMDTKLVDSYDKDRDAEKILNIAKFYRYIRDFEEGRDDKSVKAFVHELGLMLEVGEDPSPAMLVEGPDAVKVMTIHSAKGLEFTHVYIVQCVDKRFPTTERHDPISLPDALVKETIPEGDVHLEEERRLMYVAMTRAKQVLTFSYADDYGGARKKKPSRFLQELHVVSTPSTLEGTPKPSDAPKPSMTTQTLHYDLPEKFSFTQLKAFDTCPKQYWFAHVLKIPVVGRHTYSFGQSVHRTLREFYGQVQKGIVPSLEQLLVMYNNNWIDEWYASKQHEEERKTAGALALTQFYANEKDSFAQPPLYLEQPFTIQVGAYKLNGAIDRIDALDVSKKTVNIIDYKTGSKPAKAGKDALDQLVIYAIATEDILHLQPEQLTYYYLEENEKISRPITDGDIDRTKEAMQAVIARITQSTFAATPGFHCRYCDYREICEDRED